MYQAIEKPQAVTFGENRGSYYAVKGVITTDIKTADRLLKEKKQVIYDGVSYIIKELVIWYDISNKRQCSFILSAGNTSYRVNIDKCEERTG